MNELLYGHNPEQHIVSVQQFGDNKIKIYKRENSGVTSSEAEFYPFFFLSDSSYLTGFSKKHWLSELSNNNYFRYLCVFSRWSDMWDAVHHVMAKYNKTSSSPVTSYTHLPVLLLRSDPTVQYLLQSGKTLFKGIVFDDLHRLQLQIISATQQLQKSTSKTTSDRHILFAVVSNNHGWEYVIGDKKSSEKNILLELLHIIQEQDPDIIEGHDIIRRDLPLFFSRCQELGIECNIGRENSSVFQREVTKYEVRSSQQTEFEIPGRHVIDTKLLAQGFDVARRSFENYNLHALAEYFGFSRPDDHEIPSEKVFWYWNNAPEILRNHFLTNAHYIRMLSATLAQGAFYLSQIVPMNFGSLALSGASTKLELLMLREYLRKRCSIPKPQPEQEIGGGYTDIFYTGILEPILHFDVDSLYPSLMILHRLKPATDQLNIFLDLLSELTTIRLEAKQKMKRARVVHTKAYYDALQSSLKILINSFYGYLGYHQALFNDYDTAQEVTTQGQRLLRQIMEMISRNGGKVIEVDTDGIFFVPPKSILNENEENTFCSDISSTLPQGITLSINGRYKRMISYKKKNYALLGYDDKVIIRGSSLTSRSMERFCRNFLKQSIEAMLRENIFLVHELYKKLVHDIMNHKLTIGDIAKIETLNDSLEHYINEVESGKRNRSALYEAALTSGLTYRIGDKVAYYITGDDANVKAFEHAKLVNDWDPNFPDENTAYYLKRLDEVASKFKIFFTAEDYAAIFSDKVIDEQFFNNMRILTKPVEISYEPEERESAETIVFEPKIWLDS